MLRRVPEIAEAREHTPRGTRNACGDEAFAVLRELLSSSHSDSRQSSMCNDDAHRGDVRTAPALLLELVMRFDAPLVLLVMTSRDQEALTLSPVFSPR